MVASLEMKLYVLGHCGSRQRNSSCPSQAQQTKTMGRSGLSAEGREMSESQAAAAARVRTFQITEVHKQSPRARENLL